MTSPSKQKLISLGGVLLTLVMLLTLSTCQPAAKPKPEEPRGTIKIAVLGAMNMWLGDYMHKGAVVAAEEINEAGGATVGGKRYDIQVIRVDTNEFGPLTDCVLATERVITVDKANFMTGGYRSEAIQAQQEVMAQYKIPWVGTASGDLEQVERVSQDYNKYKYYFRSSSRNSMFMRATILGPAEVAVRAVREQLGIAKPRIAWLMDKGKFMDAIVEAIPNWNNAVGCEMAGLWRFAVSATTLKGELTAIQNAGAHVIVGGASSSAGLPMSVEWGTLKIPAALGGYIGPATLDEHWKVTNGACEYLATSGSSHRVQMTPTTIPFWDRYVERWGIRPEHEAMTTYGNVYIIKEAVERAGTLDADKVVAELEKTSFVAPQGKVEYFPVGHRFAHDSKAGPGYTMLPSGQWIKGELVCVHPDGKALDSWATTEIEGFDNPKDWIGVRYEGTKDYVLPPWVVEYWKGKK